jgi:hypothetical protein
MVDTRATSSTVVPRTGVKFLYKRHFFLLYAQGAIGLNSQYQRELQFNLRLDQRLNDKVDLSFGFDRIDNLGQDYFQANKFRLGINYQNFELGISSNFKNGNNSEQFTSGYVSYIF